MEMLEIFIPAKSISRNWGVYIILAENIEDNSKYIYVGKVGDNRKGCNPIISRIGNHFSFNKIHSQFRNKAKKIQLNLNNCDFKIFYKLFEEYDEVEEIRIKHKDKTNERERRLNLIIQKLLIEKNLNLNLLNKHTHLPNLKIREERKVLLDESEKTEIETFAKEVIKKALPTIE